MLSEAPTQEAKDHSQTMDSLSFNSSGLSQLAPHERLDDMVQTLGLTFGIPVLILCLAGNRGK